MDNDIFGTRRRRRSASARRSRVRRRASRVRGNRDRDNGLELLGQYPTEPLPYVFRDGRAGLYWIALGTGEVPDGPYESEADAAPALERARLDIGSARPSDGRKEGLE